VGGPAVLFDAATRDCCFSLNAGMDPGLTGGTVWLDDFYLGRLLGRR
jgi:hypothetical protein